MGSDAKRQKRLAKQKKKRQEKKSEIARRISFSRGDFRTAADADRSPFFECLVSANIFDSGLGSVFFSRRISPVTLELSVFLVDAWCLGVKNAFSRRVSHGEYQEVVGTSKRSENLEEQSPEHARKLVEGAVECADSLGFRPDPDYAQARLIFGTVDSGQCNQEFIFGYDGRPHFVAGPYETRQKCERIVRQLTESCGQGNFDLTLPMDPGFTKALENSQLML